MSHIVMKMVSTFKAAETKIRYLILLFLSCIAFNVAATVDDEIENLLSFIKSTDCLYERNGSIYSGEEAVVHIKRKQQYYHDEINSTESFIRLTATKSTLSGKHYLINCPGENSVKSEVWLLEELREYRIRIAGD